MSTTERCTPASLCPVLRPLDLKAVWGFTVVRPGLVYRANHFTDAAIVQACCDGHTCVKLFNPSAHRCGFIYVRALQDLVRQKVIDGNLAGAVQEVMPAINEQIGRPIKRFELGHIGEIEKLVAERAREEANEDEQTS
ncbi:MAG: hypothetical protein AAF970_04200 [Bacteroidota bacterium]